MSPVRFPARLVLERVVDGVGLEYPAGRVRRLIPELAAETEVILTVEVREYRRIVAVA